MAEGLRHAHGQQNCHWCFLDDWCLLVVIDVASQKPTCSTNLPMNPFVNFNQRGIDLPPGCKDLIDVLPKKASFCPVEHQQMPGLYLRDLEVLISQLYEFKNTNRCLMIQSSGGLQIGLSCSLSSKRMMFVLKPDENTLVESVKATILSAGISGESVTLRQIAARTFIHCPLPFTAPETIGFLSKLLQSVRQADGPFYVTQMTMPLKPESDTSSAAD